MIRITIKTGNAAIADGNKPYELARILRALADQFDRELVPESLADINGNKVGTVAVTGNDRG